MNLPLPDAPQYVVIALLEKSRYRRYTKGRRKPSEYDAEGASG
jgi:hypothetical protein